MPHRADALREPRFFTSSGQVNCPCGKILARGQNACTRHPARPRFAGASSVQEDLTLINTNEILDTIRMIDQQHLDIRTIAPQG